MKKWANYLATMVLATILFITLFGMYSEWHACSAKGGTTVRGLFKLECINSK